uniref:Uncharacterized protein n=1 Tax=Oryzias sinensis TaxID=183150 RepID=A0A8C7WU18_9TELE
AYKKIIFHFIYLILVNACSRQILSLLWLEQLVPKAPPIIQLLYQYDPLMEDKKQAMTETIISIQFFNSILFV